MSIVNAIWDFFVALVHESPRFLFEAFFLALNTFLDVANMLVLFFLIYLAFVIMLRQETFSFNRLLTYVLILGGLGGIVSGAKALIARLTSVSLNLFSSPAYAAPRPETGAWHSEIGPIMPWLTMGVFLVISAIFVAAAGIVLFVPDTKENKRRIQAADTIVKMFGGFLTGVGTTLIR